LGQRPIKAGWLSASVRAGFSKLVDSIWERLLFFGLEAVVYSLLPERILLSAEGPHFWRDSFSQFDHSCQWKRNEQLNLKIGFLFAQPGARACAVPKLSSL